MKKIISAALALIMALSLAAVGAQTAWADTPTEAGKVFAGWYTDDTYTTPANEETSYPKFVDEDVLKVKCQLTHLANENDDSTRIRVVTTVDSTRYQKVGFFVSVDGGAETEYATTKVARRIVGTDGLGNLEYEPSVFSAESQYFCAYNFTVGSAKFGTALSFTPFWVTMDGTEVRGEERTIRINECESFNNYLISDAAELKAFATESKSRNFAGWKVKLTADIDLNPGCVAWESGMTGSPTAWTPIGDTGIYRFAGTFDGQGHTIRGMYVSASSTYQGMFSGTAASAVIKDFKLKNSYFTSTKDSLGSIVGNAMGTFQKIYSDAIVNGKCNQTGGMIGSTSSGGGVNMSDCWFAGSARITAAKSYLGGLISVVLANSTISNCLNTGTVHHGYSVGTAYVGGFIGWLNGSGTAITISNSVNNCNPTYTAGTGNGLFVGYATTKGNVTLTNSHSLNVGGKHLVHDVTDDSGTYPTCSRQNLSDVAGEKAMTATKIKELFTAESAAGHWVCREDSFPVLSYFAEELGEAAGLIDTSWYNGSASEFTLTNAAEVYGLGLLSQSNSFSGKTVKLGADIDLNPGCVAGEGGMTGSPIKWTPIGSTTKRFAGTFDGQGYTIRGLYLNATSAYQGMFGGTDSSALIKDFRLKNSYLTSTQQQLGSIVGNAKGTFEKIYSDAFVIGGRQYTGGLIGATSDSGSVSMTECAFAGYAKIDAAQNTLGGLIGLVQNTGGTTFSNCLNCGDVYQTKWFNASSINGVGGFVGQVTSGKSVTIEDSVNFSNPKYTGGLGNGLFVGYAVTPENVALTNCHSISWADKILVYNVDDSTYPTCTKSAAEDVAGLQAKDVPLVQNLFTGSAEGHWVCSADSLPVLSIFAGEYAAGTVE